MIQITGIIGDDKKKRQYVFFTARRLEGFDADNFHWITNAKITKCTSYFVRDTQNNFYRKKNRALIRILKGIMKSFDGETWFIGSSMGGFGAILMGLYCKPDRVIAFSPSPPPKDKIKADLKSLSKKTKIQIHVCKDSKWDKVNGKTDVENALLFKNVADIIYHDGDVHNVAGILRDKGKLQGIINGEN